MISWTDLRLKDHPWNHSSSSWCCLPASSSPRQASCASSLPSLLRRRGFENNIVHVLYEVFAPFVVFLLAEGLRVSGILAVVAAGGFPCGAHAHRGASEHRADAAGARGLFERAAGRGRGQDARSVDLRAERAASPFARVHRDDYRGRSLGGARQDRRAAGRGEIDEDIAQQLRQNVYVLQMNAEAE